MKNPYFIYILSNKINTTLYVGMTNNICRRIDEHKNGKRGSFTKKYKVNKLVYIESFENKEDALRREIQIKKWNRGWKLELIEKENPLFNDLYKKYCKW